MPSEDREVASGSGGPLPSPLREQPSISPVDGRIMGWYPVAQPDDVERIAARLRTEAGPWAETPLRDRLRKLALLETLLVDRAEEITDTLACEIGRPRVEGYAAEVLPSLQCLRWLRRYAGEVLRPRRAPGMPRSQMQHYRPYGVIGLISPWNYPLLLCLPTLTAALVAGNAVLWKPSELALASAHDVRRLLDEAGLGHLVGMVPGDAAVGAAVVEAACDKYIFIGGRETGRKVLSRMGERLRPAVMELSGVDPMIVCPDADVDLAARAAVWSRVLGAGQTCMAPKRIFVHQHVYARFVEAAEAAIAAVRMGDPREPGTELGPLRTAEALDAAHAIIDEALDTGAMLVSGGRTPRGSGFYLWPTLLTDCRPAMRVMQEDVFAPIVAVARVLSVEEAVRHANSLGCGLTASVWTRDLRAGRRLAAHLRGGVVSLNEVVLPAAAAGTPFGGFGDSGFGRVRGAAGLLEMVQPCVIDRGAGGRSGYQHLLPYRKGTLEMLRALTELESVTGARRVSAVRNVVRAALRYGR